MVASTVSLQAGGGSAYSIFGVGDLRFLPNVRSAGMGYTGIGLPSANFINSAQPAAWSRINRVRVEAGLLYEGFNSSDAGRSLFVSNTEFSGAMLAVPVLPSHGLVTVLGFSPFSNVDYNLFTKDTQGGVEYTVNSSGTGGMGRGIIGLSYAPLGDLALGASMNYMFGTIEQTRIFSPSNTAFTGGKVTDTFSPSGITVSLGLQFTGLGSVAEFLTPISLGFAVTSRGNLRTKQQSVYEFLNEDDTTAEVRDRLVVPFSYGIGIAYQPGDRYVLAADFIAQAWGDATIHGVDPVEIRDTYRIGVGGERLPERDAQSWFGRLSYRLGVYYNSTYYRINGEPINEWGATGGLAIPVIGDSRLNLAGEYGARGTTTNGLVRDRFFRVSFSITLSELWFQTYEEE
jgi:hypothetical protein